MVCFGAPRPADWVPESPEGRLPSRSGSRSRPCHSTQHTAHSTSTGAQASEAAGAVQNEKFPRGIQFNGPSSTPSPCSAASPVCDQSMPAAHTAAERGPGHPRRPPTTARRHWRWRTTRRRGTREALQVCSFCLPSFFGLLLLAVSLRGCGRPLGHLETHLQKELGTHARRPPHDACNAVQGAFDTSVARWGSGPPPRLQDGLLA